MRWERVTVRDFEALNDVVGGMRAMRDWSQGRLELEKVGREKQGNCRGRPNGTGAVGRAGVRDAGDGRRRRGDNDV